MGSVKRVRLVVLFLIAAALLAATGAYAATWNTLAPAGAEPAATGEAKIVELTFLGVFPVPGSRQKVLCYTGSLSVQCHGLIPEAPYVVRTGDGMGTRSEWTFTTDASGEGASVGKIYAAKPKPGKFQLSVYVYRADGTLVLSGNVPY